MAMNSRASACAVCGARARYFTTVDGFDFFDCPKCESIAIDAEAMPRLDALAASRAYDNEYWAFEARDSRDRAYGPGLARAAEALLFARLPVQRFLDIGAGTGFLLDALSKQLPNARDKFWGVELFPPPQTTDHPNYVRGAIADLAGPFQAGVCIEVVEHLTPTMVQGLAASLAAVSEPGSIYMFNTGLSDFVRKEDIGYLDPTRRGHIISWGVPALRSIFNPAGFHIRQAPGRTWAFTAEYKVDHGPLDARIWNPEPANKAMLHDPDMGAALYLLGFESVRAYA